MREDAFFAEHGCTRVPTLVQWMATLRCRLSCPHCLAASESAGLPDMPLPTALRLVDAVAELGVEEFLITGGEPLVREDLPAVTERLGRRGVSWSLNTAAMPAPDQRRAMEKYPPAFAAVSLDGPRKVHDAFRGKVGAFDESLEAIRFFSTLDGCEVAAGTTVTSFNFPHLRETFRIVAAGEADSWGIHLLVPEGRAGRRKDLFLSRRRLRGLLRFVARLRKYYPVSLADEIGYCGDLEPLVRDVPWTCGAGKGQCVVLPDGEVVPCTTLDRSTSAGNINDRALRDIWRDGFAELRNARPAGKCGSCRYAPACGGGCWLQRRAGAQCFRDVWHVPEAVRTAAGVAICLGMLAAGQPTEARVPSMAKPTYPPRVEVVRGQPNDEITAATGGGIEGWIVRYYLFDLAGQRGQVLKIEYDPPLEKQLAADPAGRFFLNYTSGRIPRDIARRCKGVLDATGTKQRSLAFSSLLWRCLAEISFDGKAPAKRTDRERKALRTALAGLETATLKWRKEIFEGKLVPYLARGRVHIRHRFEGCKARRPIPPYVALQRDTDEERWGAAAAKTRHDALVGFLRRHGYAQAMRLKVSGVRGDGLSALSAAGERTLKDGTSLGIFDILSVPAGADKACVTLTWPGDNTSFKLSLPAGTELTYADLLMLAYKQHAGQIEAAADARSRYLSLGKRNPFLAPVMHKRWSAVPNGTTASRKASFAAYWLADFWMF